MYKTKVINLFGGPGCGKSTTAAMLFSKMKTLGYDCELVTEFAKKLTWHNRMNSLGCQPYVFGKQLHEVEMLLGKVEYIITDSPILLSIIYINKEKYPESFSQFVLDVFKKMETINILLNRTKEYNPNGRNQSEKEAKEIDSVIRQFLQKNDIIFDIVNGDSKAVDIIIENMFKKQNKQSDIVDILHKNKREYTRACNVVRDICEIQQKRQDGEFHIKAEDALCLYYDIVKLALDNEHQSTKDDLSW